MPYAKPCASAARKNADGDTLMEEWVGQWWHRAITHLADRSHPQQQVTLTEMQRSLQLLFHAGGGGVGVRVTAAAASQHAGPRRWLERVAGSGQRAA